MPASIQELRPTEVAAAAEHAGACGCAIDASGIVPSLSLIAREGDAIVALALCASSGGRRGRHAIEIVHAEGACDEALHRSLVDKALMKIRARRIKTCDIRRNGRPEDATFWGGVSWINQALPGSEAA